MTEAAAPQKTLKKDDKENRPQRTQIGLKMSQKKRPPDSQSFWFVGKYAAQFFERPDIICR